ncbi:hypothetical protein ABT56_06830 [Photobacterium aquae]|uniref:LysM domain-containing protein n=1 Tax=Photobacterium aquae TaxID=1195763 RepID=A0A0J1JYB6_9GAMM|nr:transglycosylase SLT domain-containing protein [Photobacterium aquae]KLV07242.1 hypothetical protein ABT56_06830 [Photobacterium aquae]
MNKIIISAIVLILLSGCQTTKVSEPVATTNTPEPLTMDLDLSCSISPESFKGTFIATDSIERLPIENSHDAPSLWDLMVKDFQFSQQSNGRINYYRRWYINNPYHIEQVTQRAEPFLFYIYQQVDARDFPIEIALLPFVESSFDQFAFSSKGASGLWQITAPTGRTFGLNIIRGYDGRRDIVQSTDAALDLLAYLHDKFDGNWLHAIAAYNTGEGRVKKAIKKNKKAGRSTEFWALELPKETRMYVPKLLAMAEIVAKRHQLNLPFSDIKAHTVIEPVIVKNKIKLKTIAQHSGVPSKMLYQLNPGYTAGVTHSKGDNYILLPSANITEFYANSHESRYAKEKFTVYDIKHGDSLNELAWLNNISVDEIKQLNRLNDSFIRVGQKLLLPPSQ